MQFQCQRSLLRGEWHLIMRLCCSTTLLVGDVAAVAAPSAVQAVLQAPKGLPADPHMPPSMRPLNQYHRADGGAAMADEVQGILPAGGAADAGGRPGGAARAVQQRVGHHRADREREAGHLPLHQDPGPLGRLHNPPCRRRQLSSVQWSSLLAGRTSWLLPWSGLAASDHLPDLDVSNINLTECMLSRWSPAWRCRS